MNDAVEFTIGEVVYRKIDDQHEPGMVTGIMFRATGHTFEVTWQDGNDGIHYAIELSRDPTFTLTKGVST